MAPSGKLVAAIYIWVLLTEAWTPTAILLPEPSSSYKIGPTRWQPAYAQMHNARPDMQDYFGTVNAKELGQCFQDQIHGLPRPCNALLGAQTGVMLSAVCFCIIPNYLEPAACDDLSNTGCEK